MKRLLLSLIVTALIVTGTSAVQAQDWYRGPSVTFVPGSPPPVYVVPGYRVAPVYPVARVSRYAAATAVRVPVRVVTNRAPVYRAARVVRGRAIVRY